MGLFVEADMVREGHPQSEQDLSYEVGVLTGTLISLYNVSYDQIAYEYYYGLETYALIGVPENNTNDNFWSPNNIMDASEHCQLRTFNLHDKNIDPVSCWPMVNLNYFSCIRFFLCFSNF